MYAGTHVCAWAWRPEDKHGCHYSSGVITSSSLKKFFLKSLSSLELTKEVIVAFSRSSGICLSLPPGHWNHKGITTSRFFLKNLGIAISPALTSHISKGLKKIKCLPMSVAIQRAFTETYFGWFWVVLLMLVILLAPQMSTWYQTKCKL